MSKDALQRFVFENTDIRGEIVRLDQSFQTIMQQHHYPDMIFKVLAETLMAAVLMSAGLKFEGQFTVQFQGKSAIKLLVAKSSKNKHSEDFQIRGLAQYDETLLAQQGKLLVGGELVVTVEPDNAVKPYQSIIPLNSESVAVNLENYFSQSVQIPTKIWLAVNQQCAVGMLLQLLPRQTQTMEDREIFWEHAVKLGETITDEELLTLENQQILRRLYHAEDVRLFTAEPVKFRCHCSKKRMDNVIKMLGKKETDEIFATKPVIDITCEYCNSVYSYDRIDVAAILHES